MLSVSAVVNVRDTVKTPGTVLFAGYGNTLANLDEDPRTARLRRTVDGFFLKFSYLFRL